MVERFAAVSADIRLFYQHTTDMVNKSFTAAHDICHEIDGIVQPVQFRSCPRPGVPLALAIAPIRKDIHLILPFQLCQPCLRVLQIRSFHGILSSLSPILLNKSVQQTIDEVKTNEAPGVFSLTHCLSEEAVCPIQNDSGISRQGSVYVGIIFHSLSMSSHLPLTGMPSPILVPLFRL